MEIRQLKREIYVLEMYSSTRCEHAVHLATEVEPAFSISSSLSIMDFIDGENMESVLRQCPLTDLECIQVSRSVLAALKVMHSEGIIHRDVNQQI